MARCHHHSGYLADDEAGHITYMARPRRKPLFPEMGPTSKLGRELHSLPTYGPPNSSVLRGHQQTAWGSQPFSSFLDFLVEGQVLDSLQTVVEEATEHMTAMRTQAGEPLLEVQDPLKELSSRCRLRVRPSLSTVHRHRTQPTLCTGRLNNYPSCSSSTSNSYCSVSADRLDLCSRNNDRGVHGIGALPPVKDKQLLERSLKHLLRMENKGKGQGRPSSQRGSLCSQASNQWMPEQPLSWFSGLLGSGLSTPSTYELGLAEKQLSFLKREFDKEMKSMMNQPDSFDLPSYCSIREPYHTLDFLAKHQLFPALQRVVHQAMDKLSSACRHDGCPLFCSPAHMATPKPEPLAHSEWSHQHLESSVSTSPLPYEDPAVKERPFEQIPVTSCHSKMGCRKGSRGKGWGKVKKEDPAGSGTQGATKLKVKVTPIEELKAIRPSAPWHEACDTDPKESNPAHSMTESPSPSQRAQPWQSLHLILPALGNRVDVASGRGYPSPPGPYPQTPPYYLSSLHLSSNISPHPSGNAQLKNNKKKPLPPISSKTSMSHFSPLEEEFIGFLVEKAVSLVLYKYKFEKNLGKQLGFISYPVTEVLLDLFLGFRKLEGSRIRLSSKVNWTCLLHRLGEAAWVCRHPNAQHARSPSTSPSTLPKPATDQDKAIEHNFSITELLSQQEFEEEEEEEGGKHPTPSEPKLSAASSFLAGSSSHTGCRTHVYSINHIASGTRIGSSLNLGSNFSKSKDQMDIDPGEGSEQQQGESSSESKVESQGSPKPQVQVEVKSSLMSSHRDHP
ncbi:PREDICTED: coiled-coil domain-containing protein 116 [Elephantulus edwardii]|uniref:coiled-coil domain-containing protein 116 n=1 Tax=Elephantulus edwardii TaxID=28737 RepID=UPI0003F058AD|nr:PREDICTED: coiled-coil domain-containing protein 116 [Elephantulus edwardii]